MTDCWAEASRSIPREAVAKPQAGAMRAMIVITEEPSIIADLARSCAERRISTIGASRKSIRIGGK
jgi:hypothetical protein